MDYWLERIINAPAGQQPVVDAVMVAIANWSEPAFIAVVAGWFFLGVVRGSRPERKHAIVALLAAALALGLNQVLGRLWDRPRPFVAHPAQVHLLLAHTADSSFPSDHVAAAMAIALVLTKAHRRLGGLLFALAGLVGVARVYVGDHYPGDVLAGALVGLVASAALLRFSQAGDVAEAVTEAVFSRVWPRGSGTGDIDFRKRTPQTATQSEEADEPNSSAV
jgi:undecaprenyl-diphosphatase